MSYANLDSVIQQFKAAGLPPLPPKVRFPLFGKYVRFGPGKKAWYKLFEFVTSDNRVFIVGSFGYWEALNSNTTKIDVEWNNGAQVDDAERKRFQEQMRVQRQREEAKTQELAQKAANRAKDQWRRGSETGESAYLARKKVTPEGVRFWDDGTVLVPMYHAADDGMIMAGVQRIDAQGQKRFNTGMAKIGAFARLGSAHDNGVTIYVCEGYATGRSIRMAINGVRPVYVAFDAGNLVHVAKALRARFPNSPIVFCADDDWKTLDHNKVPLNPGLVKAQEAVQAVRNACVVIPLFPSAAEREAAFTESDGVAKWTDFNDLHVHYGLELVAKQMDFDVSDYCRSQSPPDAAGPENPVRHGRVWADAIDGGASGEPPDGPPDLPPAGPPGGNHDRQDPEWNWEMDLRTKKGKGVLPVLHNLVLILENHPQWKGLLAWDLFGEQIIKTRKPPWEVSGGDELGEWIELDDSRLVHWLSSRYFEASQLQISQAAMIVANKNPRHDLRDYLTGLVHDGERRLEFWLMKYLGVCGGAEFARLSQTEKDEIVRYTELVGIKWMISAVARVLNPGCRVDTMLILEGEQGLMKSTALRVLGGDYFTDARLDFSNKDTLIIIQNRWIIEMPELESLNKSTTSAAKHFLTQHDDLYRPPYGRKLVKKKRRCVFAGTVNHDAYFKDDSGNRRFLPVYCTSIDLAALIEIRDQLWAEAVVRYKAGEPWWITKEEKYLFDIEQDKRFQVDAWEELIINYLHGRLQVTVAELLKDACKIDEARWDKMAQMRVGSIMRRVGWSRKRESAAPRNWYYAAPGVDGLPPAKLPSERDDAPF